MANVTLSVPGPNGRFLVRSAARATAGAITDHIRSQATRSMTPAQIRALCDQIDDAMGVKR